MEVKAKKLPDCKQQFDDDLFCGTFIMDNKNYPSGVVAASLIMMLINIALKIANYGDYSTITYLKHKYGFC